MIDEPEIGTAKWWRETPRDGARGTTDTILRLLEQGEITRAKARELLAWDRTAPHFADPPPAPWDRLNWCAGPRFTETWCSQCGQGFGPGDHGFSHCENHAGLPVVEP